MHRGQKAPPFVLLDEQGEPWDGTTLQGRWVVLLFYPRDFSPVCTAQLCQYRDRWELLALPEVVVVGISPDTVERHRHFRKRYRLPFPLLADPTLGVFRKYGMLTLGMMPARGVVVIDPEGTIRYRWRSVTGLRYPSAESLRQVVQRLQAGQI